VAMGRALVREPDVFLLDEPLSNLDAKLRVEMRAELKKLQERLEVTTVYVTHDQVEAMTLGQRIAVLSEGILQQVGPPQDVYDLPANVFVAGFIGSPPMNLLKAKAAAGRVVAGDLELDARVPDGDVLVGIRPEALRPVGDEHPGPGLEVRVDVVEPLGDEVLVHGTVEAKDAGIRIEDEDAMLLADAVTDRATVRLRLPPKERPNPGSRIHVAVAPEEVHVFEEATGLAIRSR
jgi:multiple sugar transport system ATP-binding protein